jgi:hypothetical protein
MEPKKGRAQSCLLEEEGRACPPPTGDFPICAVHAQEIDRRYAVRLAESARRDFMERGEEAFLFSRRDGSVYALNAAAAFIFRRLADGRSLSEILQETASAFEGPSPGEFLEDAVGFLDLLQEAGLVTGDHGE